MDNILLEIKAKHFVNNADDDIINFYCNHENCPIAIAAKDHFQTEKVGEYVSALYLNRFDENQVVYEHARYDFNAFENDFIKAKESQPEDVIRTIELIAV